MSVLDGCAVLHGWRTFDGFLRRKRAYPFQVHLSRIELLGVVRDRKTGKRYTELVLWQPWGVKASVVYVVEPRHAIQEMCQQQRAAEVGAE